MGKLFWVDLEMTGLDVEKEVVIECAAVLTDGDLQPLASYHAVVRQDSKYLDAMDEWNKNHHGASGLTALVSTGKEPGAVEDELLALIQKHYSAKERPILAGNSIAQDRLFIDKYFKRLSARLHYRMLDVTSWKILMQDKFGKKYEKKNTHRAVDDIHESIEELKYYLSFVKV